MFLIITSRTGSDDSTNMDADTWTDRFRTVGNDSCLPGIKYHKTAENCNNPCYFKGPDHGYLVLYERGWELGLMIQTFSRDISEKKYAEQQLRLLSNELEIIIDSIPGLVFYKDTKNRFIRVNKYMCDVYKMSKKTVGRY